MGLRPRPRHPLAEGGPGQQLRGVPDRELPLPERDRIRTLGEVRARHRDGTERPVQARFPSLGVGHLHRALRALGGRRHAAVHRPGEVQRGTRVEAGTARQSRYGAGADLQPRAGRPGQQLPDTGRLTENLEPKLREHGVAFRPIPPQAAFEALNEQGRVGGFARLAATFLAHFKGQSSGRTDLKWRVSASTDVQPARRHLEGIAGLRREVPTTRMGRALARFVGARKRVVAVRPSLPSLATGRCGRSSYPRYDFATAPCEEHTGDH